MGISGLTPFLLKACPHVVRELPDRFASFAGKTIAIDGTLISQRLWFAPDPHHFRHVRGWHRLLRELQRWDIKAICVFDGTSRSSAKAPELQRRRAAHGLSTARATLERKRSRRLHSFSQLWRRFRDLEPSVQATTASLTVALARDPREETEQRASCHDGDTVKLPVPHDIEGSVAPSAPPSSLIVEEAMVDTWLDTASKLETTSRPARKAISPTPSTIPSPDGLSKRMAALYRDFSRSVDGNPVLAEEISTSLRSTPKETHKTSDTGSVAISDGKDIDESPAMEVTMSKNQAQLAAEECRLWSTLLMSPQTFQGTQADDAVESFTQRVYTLSAESNKLDNSYTKRKNLPKGNVYREVRTLLDAMGIAVIEAPFPYEAEAVAASLCINGLADAVGSEDTDVLVYEAPLLRNITTRDLPLTLMSGREIRDEFQLSRDAFIDFALLLGSDFSQRLSGLGPARAIKLVQARGSIEAIIQAERAKEKGQRFLPEPKITEEEYMKQVEAGRNVFHELPPLSEDVKAQISEDRHVDEALVAAIMTEFDLGSDYWHSRIGDSQAAQPLEVDYFSTAERDDARGFYAYS